MLPPKWAPDPFFSSLRHIHFISWAAPEQRVSVSLLPPLENPGTAGDSDSEWERIVRQQLPSEALRVERRNGPAIVAELPGDSEGLTSRLAWVRGVRCGLLIEQQGVPRGSALATPELLCALETMDVPINRRLPELASRADWEGARKRADEAGAAGDRAAEEEAVADARATTQNAWLHSLMESPTSDVGIASEYAWLSLRLANMAGSVELLRDATWVLSRCARSLEAGPTTNEALQEHVEHLTGEALKLHGMFAGIAPPSSTNECFALRARLLLRRLGGLNQREVPWEVLARVAKLAFEDAMSAAAFASEGRSLRYSELSHETRLAMGIDSEASLRKQVEQDEVAAFRLLGDAAQVLCSYLHAAVNVSAVAMRAAALAAVERLVDIEPSSENQRKLVDVMSGYAGSLFELGDGPSLDEAQEILAKAQNVLGGVGDDAQQANICLNQALVSRDQGEFDRALGLVERALSIANQGNVAASEGRARAIRCDLLVLQGLPSEAIEEGRRAFALLQGRGLGPLHADLAKAYQEIGDSVEAQEHIRAGLATAMAENALGDDVLGLLFAMVEISGPGDADASRNALEAAEALYDARRHDVGGQRERIAYDDAARHRMLAAEVVERRVEDNDLPGALASADRHRARSLMDAMRVRQPEPASTFAVALLPPDASLAQQVAAAAENARRFHEAWGIPLPLGSSDLARLLAQHGRTVVLFHPAGDQVRAFIARPGAPVATVVAKPPTKEIYDLAEALRRQLGIVIAARVGRHLLPPQGVSELGTLSEGEVAGRDRELRKLMSLVHDALFSEVVPLLTEGEAVAVVPYRELAFIPFGALTGSDDTTLVERHPLSVLPSIRSLNALAEPSGDEPHAVVVGDPALSQRSGLASLSGAAAEAAEVTSILESKGIQTKLLPGPDATEPAFRTHVAGARVVHLACHAALREPASASPLFLSPSEHDDGLLLPDEISDLRLDGALVVLAACQSGLGRATSDGVLGLSRAFMQAGARTVVMSLWRVSDQATARLMPEFYRGLLGLGDNTAHLDVASAMRQAQLATRDAGDKHPSAWAPWVVLGDGGWRLE